MAKNLQHLLKFVRPKRLLMITDRGCFNAEHAVRLVREQRFDFISSLTWTEELADLYDRKKPLMAEASFLSLKEQSKRRRGVSEELWERYSIGEVPYTITHTENVEDEAGKKTTRKQSIRVRLLFVHSTANQKVCQKTRAKNTAKIEAEFRRLQRSVENGYTKDLQAVHRAIKKVYGKKQAQRYFSYEVRELTENEIQSLPPRRRGQRNPALKLSYEYHPEPAERDAQYDGLYALATSLRKKTHSTDEVFTSFKEQHHVETAHHQWKAPIRLRPVFLKTVKRIESLVFVQFLALMAFYLLQRLYRLARGPSSRTTAETLIQRFASTTIAVRYDDRSVAVIPLPLGHEQTEVLETLEFPGLREQIRGQVARPNRRQ